MSTAIDAAVVALLQADSTLSALVSARIYPDLAPESSGTPYLIVELEDHDDVPELNGITAFEQCFYVVTAVDKGAANAATAAAVNAVYERAHVVLKSTPLTVSGFSVMDVVRTKRTPRMAERDGPYIWRFVGGRYTVKADPT